ncbi:hypothetical protein LOTGIDRAFT_161690 [Lottia gigantea]|uniref:Uncharacterized protein n=1 Tax=Lottia gigantea TaxID=225164 RepID=V4AJ67_LOTGI|nr:hypothetical protein LOTGIDRAFT_161690 [Lottia gigantea]ESO93581.1 hypothetical protein LOTGIDRAFT_161690 [Lottia gigantea]
MHRPMYSSFSIDALMAPQPRLHPPFYYPGYMFMPPSSLPQGGMPDPRAMPLTHPMFAQAHLLPPHPGADYLFNSGFSNHGIKDGSISGIIPKPGALNPERSLSVSPVNSEDGDDDVPDRSRGLKKHCIYTCTKLCLIKLQVKVKERSLYLYPYIYITTVIYYLD